MEGLTPKVANFEKEMNIETLTKITYEYPS